MIIRPSVAIRQNYNKIIVSSRANEMLKTHVRFIA